MRLDRWIERVLVIAGLLLLAAAAFHMYSTLSANAGAARVEARIYKAQRDSARVVVDSLAKREVVLVAALDTATRRQRASAARFSRAASDYESARDTLVITDTTAVRAAFVKADSAIAAARLAQAQAESERDAARLLIAAKTEREQALERENAAIARQLNATQRQIPSRLERTLTAAKWLGLGAVAGAAAVASR